jgi:hypothetical protein
MFSFARCRSVYQMFMHPCKSWSGFGGHSIMQEGCLKRGKEQVRCSCYLFLTIEFEVLLSTALSVQLREYTLPMKSALVAIV